MDIKCARASNVPCVGVCTINRHAVFYVRVHRGFGFGTFFGASLFFHHLFSCARAIRRRASDVLHHIIIMPACTCMHMGVQSTWTKTHIVGQSVAWVFRCVGVYLYEEGCEYFEVYGQRWSRCVRVWCGKTKMVQVSQYRTVNGLCCWRAGYQGGMQTRLRLSCGTAAAATQRLRPCLHLIAARAHAACGSSCQHVLQLVCALARADACVLSLTHCC